MRWRAAATIETLAGVALIALLGVIVPGHWGLLDIRPHPLWLVVLAIAIWYGVPAGYVAGAAAALAYVAFLWLRPESRFRAPALHELIQPYLLLIGGVIVGELARVQRQRLREAEAARDAAARGLAELRERHAEASAAQAALERRIIGQPATISTLYQIARRFSALQPGAVYPALLDLAAEVLRADACALYLWRDGAFRLWEGRPAAWPGRPAVLATDAGLGAEVLRRWRVVTVRDLAVEGAEAGNQHPQAGTRQWVAAGPLLAGPLLDGDGQVIGILTIEAIDFWAFGPATVRLAEVLLDWAALALVQARRFEELRDRQAAADEAAAPAPTLQLLQDELYRARYYGYPVAVAVAVAPGAGGARAIERFVAAARRRCGEALAVDRLAQPDRHLLIAPMLAPDEARATLAAAAAEAAGDAPPCAVGVAALAAPGATPEQLVAAALADLRPATFVPAAPHGRYAAAREG